MRNIDNWIEEFFWNWKNHNIEKVLALFSENCEYWETPFQRIESKEILKTEWEYILRQEDIKYEYHIFNQEENSFSIFWHISYILDSKEKKEWAGTYFIRLNGKNQCIYFFQCGEPKN